jgi:hypothetical protein
MVGSIIITINPQSSIKSHGFQSRLSMFIPIPTRPSFVKSNRMPLMQQKRQASGGGLSSSMEIAQNLVTQVAPGLDLPNEIVVGVGLATLAFAYLLNSRIMRHYYSLNDLQGGINANNRLLEQNPVESNVLPQNHAPEILDEDVIPERLASLSDALDHFQSDMWGLLGIVGVVGVVGAAGAAVYLNRRYINLIPQLALSMMRQSLARLRELIAQLETVIIPALGALVANLRGRFEH